MTMTTNATTEIHVTRIAPGGGVYGHTTAHCDEAGCNGTEAYWPELDSVECSRGDVVELTGASGPDAGTVVVR